MKRLAEKIRSGATWSLTSRIIGLLAGLMINAFLARLLTAGDLGVFFILFNSITVMATVVQLGVGQALVRLIPEAASTGRMDRSKGLVKRALWVLFAANLIAAVILWGGVVPWLSRRLVGMDAIVHAVSLAVVWMIVYAVTQFLTELFRAFQNFRHTALCGLPMSNTILCLLLGAVYLFKGSADLHLVLSLCVTAGAMVIGMGLVSLRSVTALQMSHGSSASLREILPISVPIMFTSFCFLLMTRADIWIAGYFLVPTDVALYGVAARLAHFLTTPLVIVNFFLPPLIAEMNAQGQTRAIEQALRTITTLATLPVVLGVVLCLGAGRPILTFVFGPSYAGAHLVLSILALGQLAHVAAGPCGALLMMTGFQKSMMTITMSCALLFFGTAVIGGRFMGGAGIASAFSFCLGLQNLLCLCVAARKTGIRSYLTTRPCWRMNGMFRKREKRFA